MDVPDFLRFLKIAREKEREETARSQWVLHLPYMSMGLMKYVSFEEYYDKISGKNVDLRPAEEIIKEIEALHKKGGESSGTV